jgi:hypothetical protein
MDTTVFPGHGGGLIVFDEVRVFIGEEEARVVDAVVNGADEMEDDVVVAVVRV